MNYNSTKICVENHIQANVANIHALVPAQQDISGSTTFQKYFFRWLNGVLWRSKTNGGSPIIDNGCIQTEGTSNTNM